MSVTVRWFDSERTIICYRFAGKWSWDEFYPADEEAMTMMDSVDHKIDFIMDMLDSEHIPPGALQQLRRAADRNHRNMGLAVYVGMNFVVQALGELFLKLYPRSAQKYPFAFARSIEEAQNKLLSRRDAAVK